MKFYTLVAVFLLVSLTCFGKKKYTLTKDDFVTQFSGGRTLDKIYCYRENGGKVWLYFNKVTILRILMRNDERKAMMLYSVKYKDGLIEGIPYNVWAIGKKVNTIRLEEVSSFYIELDFQAQETVMGFINLDSSRQVVRIKNDSLRTVYLSREEWMLQWSPKSGVKSDTLCIRENACYHMVFKDNASTLFGVVQKITPDSIYIFSAFNAEWAAANGVAYKLYGYALADIKQLRLLKPGGVSHKVIDSKDYALTTRRATKDSIPMPYRFVVNPSTGEAEFYRTFMTFKGIAGIMEKAGKIYWYETSF